MPKLSRFLLVTIFLATLIVGVYGQAPPATSPSIVNENPPAPVLLGGNVVLYVKAGARGWTPASRATSISDRLQQIANDPLVRTDSLVIRETDVGSEIAAGDRFVMLVVDADAQAEGRERAVVAQEYVQKIRATVEQYRLERSRGKIVRGILFTLIATLALVLLLLLVNSLYRRTIALATSWLDDRIEILRGKSGDLIRPSTLKSSGLGAIRLLRIVLVLAILYTYLDLVLRLFPWTRPFAYQLAGYVLVPLARIGKAAVIQIPNIFFVLVVVVLTRYVLKFVRALFAGVDGGTITISGFYPDWAMPTYRLVRILVIAFAVVMAYPYIPGSDSEAFKGISIFLGVLVSLGSSAAIANIVAGLTMVYMRSFKVGDRVKISDFTGYVMKTRLQVTHLRTVKNEEIIVPNSKIINSEVINYSSLARELGLILHTEVTIGYDAPWRQVNALLLLAAERTAGILRNPAPFIRQKSLNDFYVTYELNVYTDDPPEMGRIYTDLHQNIQDAFNEYDVQIMSPHYENDRAERPVVARDRWYAAPANPTDLAGSGNGSEATTSPTGSAEPSGR